MDCFGRGVYNKIFYRSLVVARERLTTGISLSSWTGTESAVNDGLDENDQRAKLARPPGRAGRIKAARSRQVGARLSRHPSGRILTTRRLRRSPKPHLGTNLNIF